MPYGYYNDGGAHPLVWAVLCFVALLFAGGVVLVIMMLMHQRGAPLQTPPEVRMADALRILDERFARGEVDEDEYTKRRALLRS